MSTAEAYDHVLAQCRSIYIKKMKDYGPSSKPNVFALWR